MNGLAESSDVLIRVDPEASVAAAEASVAAALENPPEVLQDVPPTESASEGPEPPDRPPSAADFSGTELSWEVGSPCRAVWSGDGTVYPARVVAVDGERCRVRFSSYDNEEDLDLSALMSPEPDAAKSAQDWKAGSRCRAVYATDGRVYPAVVLWVRGQRCRVRFDNYNNEEECDVGALLSPSELHGGSRAPAAKSGSLRAGGGFDWKRRRREESQGERGGDRGGDRRPLTSHPGGDRPGSQDGADKEPDERRRGSPKIDSGPNPAFSFVPPFRPPLDSSSADPLSFIPPPPPPPWMSGGKESGGGGSGGGRGSDAMSSLLMQWYMCGFFTGSFMTQQKFTTS